MPENWDAEIYISRAEEWQKRAASLPEGPEKETCVELAEGYARLAHFIGARGLDPGTRSEAEPVGAGENAVTSLTSFSVVCADGTNVRHTGSLDSAIRVACELECAGHPVMRIDHGASTALEGENLRMAIGGRSSR
jgi:hypothetical protein